MTPVEIQKVLEDHARWLLGEGTGKFADLRRANLRGADLRGVSLCGVNLRKANLRGADLRAARLEGANLCEADLRGANLQNVNLHEADLRGADLRRAELRWADLRWADLKEADLCGANLSGADFRGAILEGVQLPPEIVPKKGEFVGWKKCKEGVVKLLIPADARRMSALSSRKCRADKALVLETPEGKPACSYHKPTFHYVQGKTVVEPDYDPDRRVECGQGIHFFMTRQEAKEYGL